MAAFIPRLKQQAPVSWWFEKRCCRTHVRQFRSSRFRSELSSTGHWLTRDTFILVSRACYECAIDALLRTRSANVVYVSIIDTIDCTVTYNRMDSFDRSGSHTVSLSSDSSIRLVSLTLNSPVACLLSECFRTRADPRFMVIGLVDF